MDFFASDAFLTALARDFHRARTFRFRYYDIQGLTVRLAEIEGKRPLVSGPFYDYVKPLAASAGPDQALRFLPKVLTSTVELDGSSPPPGTAASGEAPAPIILWKAFPAWPDYEAVVRARSKGLLSGIRRRRKRISEDHGETTFEPEDRNPAAFELLCNWKKDQYEGGHETLENPRAVAMLHGLFNEGHLVLSSLKVGARYVAIKAGFLWEGQYLSLLPAYDPAFASYGVGKDLLLRTMENSYRRGDVSFDFLQGSELYKYDFATHVQIIEPLGTPTLPYVVRTRAEAAVKSGLQRISPKAFYGAKRAILSARRLRHSVGGAVRRGAD